MIYTVVAPFRIFEANPWEKYQLILVTDHKIYLKPSRPTNYVTLSSKATICNFFTFKPRPDALKTINATTPCKTALLVLQRHATKQAATYFSTATSPVLCLSATSPTNTCRSEITPVGLFAHSLSPVLTVTFLIHLRESQTWGWTVGGHQIEDQRRFSPYNMTWFH